MRAKERIERYGIEAFLKSLGKEVVKKRGGHKALLKFYTEKYIGVPVKLEPTTKGRVSRQMKSYWKDVKLIVTGRGKGIVETRKLMKREGAGKDVTLRVIKAGEGWQLTMLGLYHNEKSDYMGTLETGFIGTSFEPDLEAEGFSYVHKEKEYDECLNECIRMAQGFLGGSNWKLVKVISYQWNRYYGREK